jgi:hypothetical protein
MRFKKITCVGYFLLLVAFATVTASAQTDDCSARTFDIWLNCEIAQVAGARLNQQAPNKQPQAPSVAGASTSLVDQTTAPDLFGLALNLAGLSGNSNDNDTDKTSMSLSTSAYALYAAALQRDPLDPAFYRRHPNLRRFYFTFGQETPEDEDSGDKDRATLLGMKFLIINRRDVSHRSNRARLERIAPSLSRATVDTLNITKRVQNYLYSQLSEEERAAKTLSRFVIQDLNDFPTVRGNLADEQLKQIRDIISDLIESRVLAETEERQTINKIRKAPQLAFTFDSKLRKADGTDEYRGGLAFDYGLHERMNVTANGTLDYADSKTVGGDKRGGRVAGEATFKLTRERNPFGGTGPYLLSVSGESKWMNDTKATHIGQVKLTIPVFNGISFPISLSVANRSELVKEKTVRGRFGFSFDFTKLFNELRR